MLRKGLRNSSVIFSVSNAITLTLVDANLMDTAKDRRKSIQYLSQNILVEQKINKAFHTNNAMSLFQRLPQSMVMSFSCTVQDTAHLMKLNYNKIVYYFISLLLYIFYRAFD